MEENQTPEVQQENQAEQPAQEPQQAPEQPNSKEPLTPNQQEPNVEGGAIPEGENKDAIPQLSESDKEDLETGEYKAPEKGLVHGLDWAP